VSDPIELAVIERGAGAPVALVHGGVFHSGPAWAKSMGALVDAGYRVIAVDRRGHGRSPQDYRAFIPAPLPPDPPVELDQALVSLLSKADLGLERLDGMAQTLPNPDLFVAMYVRREAVYSSQTEGKQSTLDDVLAFERDPEGTPASEGR
jgi:alpha-beta hydrolase superfamily lysophospholipase